ncbi:MAG: PmoA family protein, partial [Planctomycetaceae bacterium]|nr:PmoA family protein [Planctomycetaceae bacterium]
MTQISSIILCAIVMINSNQTIVSGSFGVAWLNDDKVISVFDANSVTQPVPNIKVNAILAADVLEEGSEQLLFLDEAKKALHVYSFKTKMVLGPFGSNIKTFAAGRWSDKESFPSVFVNTFSGQAFRWTKEIMGKGWESVSGAFEKAASIKLKPNSRTDDFVVVADGMLYTFNTKWQTYSSQPEAGKNIVALLTGNVTGSPADDVVFFDKSGTVFLYNNQTVENLKQQVICLTLGKNGGDLDALYGLDKRGKPVIYDRSAKSWKSVPFQNAFYCTNIITRTNPDGKGHELFVVRNNDLYQITADGTVKQLSEQKQTKIVLTDGEKPLAEYRFANVPFKPYIDILRTPSGRNILRDAPYDHLHHHGLMFAIAVNGCNFWEEFTPRHGKEITVSIKPQPDTATSFLESELEWRNGESQTLIRESRKISVSGGNSAA